jgi:hypothetical protein
MEPASSQAQPSVNDDDSFLSRFEHCTLPESEWTHLAHVRVAWLYLSRHSPDTALSRVCDGILRYNTEVLNRPEKYSETVTVAFLHVVLGRMQTTESWDSFSMRIDDLLDADTPILLNYYSQEVLFSDAARLQFVEPDMAELPCFNTFNLAPGYRDGRAQN